MFEEYIPRILRAKVYDVAIQTPIDTMNFLSARVDNTILVKREDLQPVFSFKLRGAFNKMTTLSDSKKKQGVIAASAGNHAQGVALAAEKMGINACIVMPRTTPEIKINSVAARGARVVLHGDSFDQAYKKALQLSSEEDLCFIHPYDDPEVIAGQGTVGMEIVRQYSKKLDAVFIPVGGGGLAAGVSLFLKYVRPEIKVIGVEAEDSACLTAALEQGRRVILDQVGIFADGVAVAQIGEETFRIARRYIDQTITVNTDQICSAIKDLFDDTRSIAEPAGALALAGLKKYVASTGCKGRTLLAIESGANVNFDRLRYISERTELGEKREAILAVTIPEKPGSFLTFCRTLENHNITEFNYRYSDVNTARVFVGVQLTTGGEQVPELVKRLCDAGYTALDMSSNELAKLHVRHMVGGHAVDVKNEKLFRFEFPERPLALLKFLENMSSKWNISMFHYRNHGAAFGRVFLGLQVPDQDRKNLDIFLDCLGYRYFEETGNPAYKLFLS